MDVYIVVLSGLRIEWDEKDATIALNGLVIIVDAFIFVLSTVA